MVVKVFKICFQIYIPIAAFINFSHVSKGSIPKGDIHLLAAFVKSSFFDAMNRISVRCFHMQNKVIIAKKLEK